MPVSTISRAILSRVLVFDSSLWIDQWRTGRHSAAIALVLGRIRLSSVVQSERWRGVTRKPEAALLTSLEKNYGILTPTEKNWLESGLILGEIRTDHGFQHTKLRDLHFDILIAFTARAHGGTLITCIRKDFELIRSYRGFELEVW